ncbi:hypothetical protein ALO87_00520 [Pseudomonas syringae pv. apii]|nr:hypothetical protein ALO87_00520 [Pseudomonas syringae pv. apii]
MNITITEVHPADIPQTVDFVMRARAEIFPLLDAITVPLIWPVSNRFT